MKRSKRAYDICSMLYLTALKKIIESIEQDNRMPTRNGAVPAGPRIQVQIPQPSQQQQEATGGEKRTLISETDEEGAVEKELLLEIREWRRSS